RGLPYFAMEFVEGESVADRLKREGRLASLEARRIILQAAQGLAVAHEFGVVHRDIKPANLLISTRGVVKVADFGIALAASDMQQKLTGTGQLVGTPGYLSPEVCLGKPTDARSDIFSLGIVLFEMLTGRMPFLDESPLGLMLSVVQSNLPDVRDLAADVDEYTVQILEAMVAKDPEARYQNCQALVEALLAAGTPYHPGQTGHTPVPSRATAETSLATPVPARPATPPPAPVQSAAPSAQSTPAVGPTAVMPTPVPPVKAAAPRRSRWLPVAVAAALLLAMAAATAMVLLRSSDSAAPPLAAASLPPAAATSSGEPPSPAASSVAPEAAAADHASVAGADTAQVSAGVEPVRDSAALPSRLPEPAQAEVVANAAPQQLAVAAPPAETLSSPVESVPAATLAEAQPAGPAAANPPPRPLQRLAEARQERVAMRSESAPERRPAPPPARLPERTLVLAIGDPAVTGPAQAAIEAALEAEGVRLADTEMVPGLGRYSDDDLPGLLGAVARAGVARTIVTLRVVPVGQQELTYYGERSTQYTAQLRLRAYDVAERQPIGRMHQTQVSFTSLNAAANTQQALDPLLGPLASALAHR
ncbi:MAG: protein kinase, partial [Xanthomonadales bacterium]|nr:protein kinase [Xanthomonadales bacterium]